MASSKTTTSRRLLIGAVGAFILLAGAMELWRRLPASAGDAPVRLAGEDSLATEPALSPDGKLVAYASDRGGEVLDIWVQPAGGGEARRIASGDADSRSPAFSPDGRRIAFRSESGEGGIYVAPVGGGEPVLAAAGGRDPRFSPDGKWLAWWVRLAENQAEIRVGPADGGESRRLAEEFRSARYPVWSPDGRHLLFLGEGNERSDWFVVPVEGGPATRTGGRAILGIQGFWSEIVPRAWIGDEILFTGRSERSVNAWRIRITPGIMQFTAGAKRITSGDSRETHAAWSAGGAAAYATASVSSGVWMLPLDPATGAGAGDPVKVADGDDGGPLQASASHDGRRVVFRRKEHYWLKDLESGSEAELKAPARHDWPVVISPDGASVAYHDEGHFFSEPLEGGERQRICRNCWGLWSWSADGARVLFNQHGAIWLAYTANAEKREILRHSDTAIYDARFSPDGRWIAFHMGGRRRGDRRQVWIAPYREGPRPKESEWIAVTPEDEHSRNPCWSADGGVLYYLSERDGFRCIWGQRLDRATRRPQGKPFAVRHFHGTRYGLTDPANPGGMSLAAARNRLVFTMYETRGEVWVTRAGR
jgi:eukaryotic-like serine/threonine-protein kinase